MNEWAKEALSSYAPERRPWKSNWETAVVEFQQCHQACLSLTNEPYSHFHRPNARHVYVLSSADNFRFTTHCTNESIEETFEQFKWHCEIRQNRTHFIYGCLVFLVPVTNDNLSTGKRANPTKELFLSTTTTTKQYTIIWNSRSTNQYDFRTRVHDKLYAFFRRISWAWRMTLSWLCRTFLHTTNISFKELQKTIISFKRKKNI